ncbi:SRPBCC domain-containing protein [Nocardia sp. NPDC127579]|uniref:SRPBCC family protein n=1 Tax=Nocardia sp. NPDC127579 TaxID=3345402 RepID=UPI00362A79E7
MVIADPRLDPAAVELGAFFAQPAAVVWDALTRPDLLERWLLRPTGFATSVGTRFRFTVPTTPDDTIDCEVLAVGPRERLTYSWRYRHAHWTVDWRLRPQGRGTRLLLTQTGFDIGDRREKMARNAAERGWKRNVLPRLGEVIHH